MPQGVNQVDRDPDANTGIGHIKGWVNVVAKMQIDEVNYMAVKDSIQQVADNPATKKAESELHRGLVELKGPSPVINAHQCQQGDQGQEGGLPAKKTPRRPGVAHVDKIKKTVDNRDGVKVVVGAVEGNRQGNPSLAELVEPKHRQTQHPEKAISLDALPTGWRRRRFQGDSGRRQVR